MAAMITIANANALHIPLPDRSVQCIVTSPPYYGLRDYGTAKWEGGSAECDHIANANATKKFGSPEFNENRPSREETKTAGYYSATCPRCGAVRIDAQIGLEPTPAAYVANIVAVMRECWRVLKDDGVLWLNLGDSYAGANNGYSGDDRPSNQSGSLSSKNVGQTVNGQRRRLGDGLKQKDLIGIPWHVAFALQDDGWYLRQDIIWAKPNPMPESVTDRCTKAHEYVFLLTKRARYYYDAEAIAEQALQPNGIAKETAQHKAAILGQSGGTLGTNQGASTRNRRSVWTVATQPYSGSHFAVFPMALIEPMILAGTSARGECPHCGKAWVRVTEKIETPLRKVNGNGPHGEHGQYGQARRDIPNIINTIDWRQQCSCPPHDPIPQTVLDPFAGSGTTGAVAVKHGRRAVLLDLNTKYIDLQFERTNGVQMMFETIAPNSPSNDVAR